LLRCQIAKLRVQYRGSNLKKPRLFFVSVGTIDAQAILAFPNDY
jgi:hypothetical protein